MVNTVFAEGWNSFVNLFLCFITVASLQYFSAEESDMVTVEQLQFGASNAGLSQLSRSRFNRVIQLTY